MGLCAHDLTHLRCAMGTLISSMIGTTEFIKIIKKKNSGLGSFSLAFYQSQVSILGPVGYGPTTLPLRHSDLLFVYGQL